MSILVEKEKSFIMWLLLALSFMTINYFSSTCVAAIVFEESFEEIFAGQKPADWNFEYTGSPLVKVTDEKASNGEKSLLIDNTNTGTHRVNKGNVMLQEPINDGSVLLKFDIFTEDENIRYTFHLGIQPFLFSLRMWDKTFQTMVSGEAIDLCDYKPNVWYRVYVIIPDFKAGKYSLKIEQLDHMGSNQPIPIYEAETEWAFAYEREDINGFEFRQGSSQSKSKTYLDNILIISNYKQTIGHTDIEYWQDADGDGGFEQIMDPIFSGALANSEPIEIRMTLKDALGEPISNKNVELISDRNNGENRDLIQAKTPLYPENPFGPGVTDSSGIVSFTLETKYATMLPGLSPVGLKIIVDGFEGEAIQKLNLRQALSLQYSEMLLTTVEPEKPVVANGRDAHAIKVKLRDYSNQPLYFPEGEGPIVKLQVRVKPDSMVIAISPEDGLKLGTNGETADFLITATKAGLARIGVEVMGHEFPTEKELSISFVPTVAKIVQDSLEVFWAQDLDSLPEGIKPADDEVPADGVSFYKSTWTLLDNENQPVQGSRFQLQIPTELKDAIKVDPNITLISDDNGKVSYSVSYLAPEITDLVEIELISIVDNDYEDAQLFTFVPDRWGPIGIGKYPNLEPGEKADVRNPIWLGFNEPVVLDDVLLRLVPYDKDGNEKTELIVSTDATDPNFRGVLTQKALESYPEIPATHTLHFTPNRKLRSNLIYRVEVDFVKDKSGNELFKEGLVDWEFICEATSPPKLVSSIPESGQRQVSSTLNRITLTFDEELDTKNGILSGQFILERITGGDVVTLGTCLVYDYSFNTTQGTSKVELQLPEVLLDDNYYRLRIFAVSDVGGENSIPEGEPVFLVFKTTSTRAPQTIYRYPQIEARDIPYENLKVSLELDDRITATIGSRVWLQKIGQDEQEMGEPITGVFSITNSGVVGMIKVSFVNLTPDSKYRISIEGFYDEDNNQYLDGWVFYTKPRSLEVEEPYLADGMYVFKFPVSATRYIMTYIPEAMYSPEMRIGIQNVSEYDKKQMIKKLSQGHFASNSIYMYAAEQDKFGTPITIALPYIKDGNDIEMLTSSGESSYVQERQLYVAYYRSWINAKGFEEGEWIPLASTIDPVTQMISAQIEQPGIYSICAAPAWGGKLIERVALSANPFTPGAGGLRGETTFKFNSARNSRVTLDIYDATGRHVVNLLNDQLFPAGYHGFTWTGIVDGKALPTGLYIYRLSVRSVEPDNPNVDWISGVVGIKH